MGIRIDTIMSCLMYWKGMNRRFPSCYAYYTFQNGIGIPIMHATSVGTKSIICRSKLIFKKD